MGKQIKSPAAATVLPISAGSSGSGADAALLDAAASGVDERYLVPALMRGLQALQVFSGERQRLTLSELAAAIGLTRSSAYRLVYTLDHLGFLSYDATSRTYSLGAQVLQLGFSYLAARDLVAVAMPHLERLRDRTTWSAHLGELRGTEVVYIARVSTRRSVASIVQVGSRLPAHATAMGRILIAALGEDEIRARYRDTSLQTFTPNTIRTLPAMLAQAKLDAANGFVVQTSGYEAGVSSVAAPVRDINGHVIAAINISAVTQIVDDATLRGSLKDEVVRAAAAISHDLGNVKAAGA